MMNKNFYLHLPERRTTGVVFSSPHSGRDYPAEMVLSSDLTAHQLRSSEDAFVDDLFMTAPQHGAVMLAASAPRAFVDLNRSAGELDPALIKGVRKTGLSPRISSGLGVIPRVVADGQVIRQGKMTQQEAERRLQRYYHPYHAKLKDLLDTTHKDFGQVLLIDCHSMPHDSLSSCKRMYGKTPSIVLGDRYGSSCDPEIVDQVEEFFKMAGFDTARNMPFAGAHIAQHYGRPSAGRSVLQVEIDRSLYMDEASITRRPEFDMLCDCLGRVVGQICDLGRRPVQVAAQ